MRSGVYDSQQGQILGFKTNILSARGIANIAVNDAMILPHDGLCCKVRSVVIPKLLLKAVRPYHIRCKPSTLLDIGAS